MEVARLDLWLWGSALFASRAWLVKWRLGLCLWGAAPHPARGLAPLTPCRRGDLNFFKQAAAPLEVSRIRVFYWPRDPYQESGSALPMGSAWYRRG